MALGISMLAVSARTPTAQAQTQTQTQAPTQPTTHGDAERITTGGRMAFDATLGLGHGAGGAPAYVDRRITSMALLLARRLGASPRRHALAAVAAGADVNLTGVACLAEVAEPGNFGSCRTFPGVTYLSALVGFTTHGTQDRGLRFFGGPALTDNGFGVLARADAAAPITTHLAFVWRGQLIVGPRDVSERLQMYSWGMGIRVR